VPGKVLDDALVADAVPGNGGPWHARQEPPAAQLYLGNFEDLPDAAQRLIAGVIDSGGFQRSGSSACPSMRAWSPPRRRASRTRCGAGGHTTTCTRCSRCCRCACRRCATTPRTCPSCCAPYIDELTEAESRRRSAAPASRRKNRLPQLPWPGNLRELRNLVRRLLLRGGGAEISLQEVEAELGAQAPGDGPLVKQDLLALPLREAREHFERAYLTQQLQLCDGRVGQLAKRVGMERTHLYRKLRSLGIEIGQSAED
jgi:hypothetical protein